MFPPTKKNFDNTSSDSTDRLKTLAYIFSNMKVCKHRQ